MMHLRRTVAAPAACVSRFDWLRRESEGSSVRSESYRRDLTGSLGSEQSRLRKSEVTVCAGSASLAPSHSECDTWNKSADCVLCDPSYYNASDQSEDARENLCAPSAPHLSPHIFDPSITNLTYVAPYEPLISHLQLLLFPKCPYEYCKWPL